MNISSFDVGSLITCWFRKWFKINDFSKYYIVLIPGMYEGVRTLSSP